MNPSTEDVPWDQKDDWERAFEDNTPSLAPPTTPATSSNNSKGSDRQSSAGTNKAAQRSSSATASNNNNSNNQNNNNQNHHNSKKSKGAKDDKPIASEASATTGSAWRPSKSLSEKEKAIRTLKGLLNKLTIEKFDTIAQQIVEALPPLAEVWSEFIGLIFQKATSELHFCLMYASLCKHLSARLLSFEEDKKAIVFKTLLLNRCQGQFEEQVNRFLECQKSEQHQALPKEEQEANLAVLRKHLIGVVTFIGELFKEEMLNNKIMHSCMNYLLNSETTAEAEIEAACKLLKTVGKKLDDPSSGLVEPYMVRLSELQTNGSLSSRVKFLIEEVIELRQNNWVARQKVEAAKSLKEIRQEAEKESRFNPTARGGPMAPAKPYEPTQPVTRFAPNPATNPSNMRPNPNMPTASRVPMSTQATTYLGPKPGSLVAGGWNSAANGPSRPLGTGMLPTPAAGGFPHSMLPHQTGTGANQPAAQAKAEAAKKPKKAKPAPIPNISTSEIDDILEELLSSHEISEALEATRKFHLTPEFAAKTVERAVFARDNKKRNVLCELLQQLQDKKQLTWKIVKAAIVESLKVMDDLAVDDPSAPAGLGFCVSILCSQPEQQADAISIILDAVPEAQASWSKVVGAWLKSLLDQNQAHAKALYNKFNLDDLFARGSSGTKLEFLQQHGLIQLDLKLVYQTDLTRLFQNPTDLKAIHTWCTESVAAAGGTAPPELASSLMSSFLRYCHSSTDTRATIRQFKNVLIAVLGSSAKRQLAGLLAVQQFSFDISGGEKNQFPAEFVKKVFKLLYDEEIIYEDVFNDWKEHTDDSIPCKMECLFAVNPFLTWLAEAEEDSDEDD